MVVNTIKKKLMKIQIIMFLLLSAIGGKLAYSQIVLHDKIMTLATDLWERSFPIEASRGYILDRNDKYIAMNLPCISVAVIPYQIDNADTTAKNLSQILKVSYSTIYDKITKRASVVRLQPEGRQINESQASKIEALNLPGVYLVQDSLRYYPYSTMMSPSIGFVGIDNQGLAGLESYYDEVLKGKNGSLNYLMDAKGGLFGNYQSELVAPVQGMTLRLTVDWEIQSVLERELSNAYLKYNAESIYGIAMDPNTGEILAMGNYPSFDPNNYQDYSQELYNRNIPIWKSYEPGSTFKVFSFAAGLDQNKFDMYKDTYYDKGYEIVGGQNIKSWKKGGHGLQTFLEVLENSSNPGFVEIARRLGKDNLYNYIHDFGFNNKTGVDIMGEANGIFFKYDKFNEVEQATSAFGQGISVTMVQMVTAFSATINGGYLLTPHIAKEVLHTTTGDVLTKNDPHIVEQVIKNETSDLMRVALESVVAKGSGHNAYIDGYRVGGKTGTAQIVGDNGQYLDGEYILSFIGAAPMNDPKIVVYVCIEKPKNTVQYGGTVAAPIVRSILEDSLPILNVPRQNSQLDKEYFWYDKKIYEVPNFIGLEKKQVKSSHFSFIFQGEGTKVIDQLPKVGTRMNEGNSIIILLG